MVYVQDIDGKPMMPTTRHGKVRRLLKDSKAVVVNTCPFTIKLTYKTSDYKQEIVLGVDSGTKHVGLSATTKSKELYASEVILRSDVVDLIDHDIIDLDIMNGKMMGEYVAVLMIKSYDKTNGHILTTFSFHDKDMDKLRMLIGNAIMAVGYRNNPLTGDGNTAIK